MYDPCIAVFFSISALLFVVTVIFLLLVTDGVENSVWSSIGLSLPYFKTQARLTFVGLMQCVSFGWLYGLAVFVWRRSGRIDYARCFRIEGRQVPFLDVRWLNISRCYRKLRRALHEEERQVEGEEEEEREEAGDNEEDFDDYHHDVSFNNDNSNTKHTQNVVKKPLLLSKSTSSAWLTRLPRGTGRVHSHRRVWMLTSLLSIILSLFVFLYAMYPYSYSEPSLHDKEKIWPGSSFPVTCFVFFALFLCLPTLLPSTSTRLSLATVFFEVLFAPIKGVEFVHVLVCDAWTSSSLLLWQLEVSMCWMVTGISFDTHDESHVIDVCADHDSLHYRIAEPVMYALPFYLRFVQCAYRCVVTWRRNGPRTWQCQANFVNAGKYFSAIMVVVSSVMFAEDSSVEWKKYHWIAWLVVKTLYCAIWDVKMDWSLPRSTEKGYTYERRWLYAFACVSNLLLRCSWSLAISVRSVYLPPSLKPLLALAEILRRFQWMVFRVENEDLSL